MEASFPRLELSNKFQPTSVSLLQNSLYTMVRIGSHLRPEQFRSVDRVGSFEPLAKTLPKGSSVLTQEWLNSGYRERKACMRILSPNAATYSFLELAIRQHR